MSSNRKEKEREKCREDSEPRESAGVQGGSDKVQGESGNENAGNKRVSTPVATSDS